MLADPGRPPRLPPPGALQEVQGGGPEEERGREGAPRGRDDGDRLGVLAEVAGLDAREARAREGRAAGAEVDLLREVAVVEEVDALVVAEERDGGSPGGAGRVGDGDWLVAAKEHRDAAQAHLAPRVARERRARACEPHRAAARAAPPEADARHLRRGAGHDDQLAPGRHAREVEQRHRRVREAHVERSDGRGVGEPHRKRQLEAEVRQGRRSGQLLGGWGGEPVPAEVQGGKDPAVAELPGDRTGQVVVLEAQAGEPTAVAQARRNGAREQILREIDLARPVALGGPPHARGNGPG